VSGHYLIHTKDFLSDSNRFYFTLFAITKKIMDKKLHSLNYFRFVLKLEKKIGGRLLGQAQAHVKVES
jgi:hypothetical protein